VCENGKDNVDNQLMKILEDVLLTDLEVIRSKKVHLEVSQIVKQQRKFKFILLVFSVSGCEAHIWGWGSPIS